MVSNRNSSNHRANNKHRRVTLRAPQSLNAYVKSICDIMRRGGAAGALQYVPELTWMLFLRILDENEERELEAAQVVGEKFTPSLAAPYRWRDWASPHGTRRLELGIGTLGGMMKFVNEDLLPHLRGLKDQPNANARQKVIGQVFAAVERTRIDTERNLLDILDKVDTLSAGQVDQTHMFTLSQVYEGLLLKMGEKNNDGGQFFTPREVIRAMVRVVNPQVGGTVYDPCCGTGGFLAQAFEFMRPQAQTPDAIEAIRTRTFWGREKENLVYPIALANLVLHGIDEPHIWHGNTLTDNVVYDGLFAGAPVQYNYVLTNPPFGGKEGKEAQTKFAFKTGATQVLFLQHVISALKDGGTCGIVLDEGVLFRTNETAFVQTKLKLLDECDLFCIVSLPSGVFLQAGGGVKTNLLFFTKGKTTESVWYYDLSDVKMTKKQPLTLAHFDDFFGLLPTRAETDKSWNVRAEDLRTKNYDLKAVNPRAKNDADTRTPGDLYTIIEDKQREIAEALARLKKEN
jgi:type I restriction enzyme M protein